MKRRLAVCLAALVGYGICSVVTKLAHRADIRMLEAEGLKHSNQRQMLFGRSIEVPPLAENRSKSSHPKISVVLSPGLSDELGISAGVIVSADLGSIDSAALTTVSSTGEMLSQAVIESVAFPDDKHSTFLCELSLSALENSSIEIQIRKSGAVKVFSIPLGSYESPKQTSERANKTLNPTSDPIRAE